VVLADPRVLSARPKVSAIMSIHGMSATSFHQPPRKVTERAAGAGTERG
jgi:hypothetical protein